MAEGRGVNGVEAVLARNRACMLTVAEKAMMLLEGGEKMTGLSGWDWGMDHALPVGPVGYVALRRVLDEAFNQAASGKGSDRHAAPGENFTRQIICEVERRLPGFCGGQAVKKIYEAERLEETRGCAAADAEDLGAIVYLAARILVRRERDASSNTPVKEEQPCR